MAASKPNIKNHKKKKSGSGLAILVWLLILLGAAGGAGYYYKDKIPPKYRDQLAKGAVKLQAQLAAIEWEKIPLPKLDGIKAWWAQLELPKFDFLFGKKKELPPPPVAAPLPPPPPLPPKEKPKVAKVQGPTEYFIRVGRCVIPQCVEQITGELKRMGMDPKLSEHQDKVQMFELLSDDVYREDIIYAKMEQLEYHNKMKINPSSFKVKGGYRITFGTFPEKDRAIQMQGYTHQLVPQTDIRFSIHPRTEVFATTSIFAGPFTNHFNANSAAEVLAREAQLQETTITNGI